MDINSMNETELRELNQLIGKRIKELMEQRVRKLCYQLEVGEVVSFHSRKQQRDVVAKIDKINRKTAVVTEVETGLRWKVSISLLQRIED